MKSGKAKNIPSESFLIHRILWIENKSAVLKPPGFAGVCYTAIKTQKAARTEWEHSVVLNGVRLACLYNRKK